MKSLLYIHYLKLKMNILSKNTVKICHFNGSPQKTNISPTSYTMLYAMWTIA